MKTLIRTLVAFTALAFGSLPLPAQPVITSLTTNQVVANGCTAVFMVGVSGTGPFTYQWQFNATNLPNNLITTIAGNGSYGYSGDGGTATNAKLNGPVGVAVDGSDSLFIADKNNNCIRKVDVNGTITTVAGNGILGNYGDGGAATNAELDQPYGVAVDGFGNLFIADTGNYCIRKVDTNGFITTIAGVTSYGLAVDSFGNLFIADKNNNSVRMLDTNGIISTVAGKGSPGFSGDGGMATNARLSAPYGVAVDTFGNLFIADYNNNRIRKVDTNGFINTVGGTNASGYFGDGGSATTARLNHPYGVTVDPYGCLFIADYNNYRIRQVDGNGIITTVAGNGGSGYSDDGIAATNASLSSPTSVALDNSGNLFAALNSYRVAKIDLGRDPYLMQKYITTNNAGNYDVVVTDSSGSVTSSIVSLTVVFPPSIVSQPTNQIVLNGNDATFALTVAGTTNFGYNWYFNGTNLVGMGATLTVNGAATSNVGSYKVVVTNLYGCVTSSPATLAVAYIIQPTNQIILNDSNATFGVAVSGEGTFTYQWRFNGTNLTNNIITTVAGTNASGFSGDNGPAALAKLKSPNCVVVDYFGNLFVSDSGNNRIRKVDLNGIITTVAGTNAAGFSGDYGAATVAKLNNPFGIAVDAWGNMIFVDRNNNRIRRVDTNGVIITVAGGGSAGLGNGGAATNATLNGPCGLAVDGSGNLFFADEFNARGRQVDTNGIITTIAGNGNAGSGGDGGVATNANFTFPTGMAVDGLGNVFIADYPNNCVRKVNTSGIIVRAAGIGTFGYSGDGGAATNAQLYWPYGLAMDGNGNLFIADGMNYRIRRVDTNGIITTAAGNGNSAYSGDGGVATNAGIGTVTGIALDNYGNLFAALRDYNRIVKISMGLGGPSLVLGHVTTNNAGNYDVIITSLFGSVTSSVSTLTVVVPTFIVVQPTNQIVIIGSNATFTVSAGGTTNLGYNWYFNGTNLVGTNATLILNNVDTNDAGSYSVVVTNLYGGATSSVVSLTVVFPPSITVQPTNQMVLSGHDTTFAVTAAGTGPFVYQWRVNGANITNGIITTIAGNGTTNCSGDGGPAINATFNRPVHLFLDTSRNLFIADMYNNCIRKIDANGIITTVAGSNSGGYSGDGSPATIASLSLPDAAVEDDSGNLFIADTYNNCIRKVDTNGIINTIAGTSTNGYSGDGGAATNANMYWPVGGAFDKGGNFVFVDRVNSRVRKIDITGIISTIAGGGLNGGDGGAATNCSNIFSPSGVAFDAIGNLFITVSGNDNIRMVDTNGIIWTVAGTHSPGYSGDGGLAFYAGLRAPYAPVMDANGNLFFADSNNHCIRKVDTNGIITTVAGNGILGYSGDGGMATNANLDYPFGLAVDAHDDLFIADSYNNRIRFVTPVTGNPVLSLNNASASAAGNYCVVVFSPYGSVTSSIATLTIVLPPQNFAGNVSAGAGLQLQFSGTPNYPYVLLCATNLTPPIDWEPVLTNFADTNGVWSFTDTNFGQYPQKFYRASTP